ncbi:MAG: uracil-DNA glycosylase [Desulfobacterales bacterium]|nr:uracil-DNA glycosylase [Desulfobacterales bacterium]
MLQFKNRKIKAHKSWRGFWDEGTVGYLEDIQEKIGSNFTPPAENVFRFMASDLSKLKVVILGQDPYPQRGVATGRAFEVGNIHNWNELKRNTSLQNIIKLIYKNYVQCNDVASIAEVRKAIDSKAFNIAPPHHLFKNWEKQGVLLINTSLTCEIEKPNSHSEHWEIFSRKVVEYIKIYAPETYWFLWGAHAKKYGNSIQDFRKFESKHPRLNSRDAGSFLGENHLGLALGVNWLGGE